MACKSLKRIVALLLTALMMVSYPGALPIVALDEDLSIVSQTADTDVEGASVLDKGTDPHNSTSDGADLSERTGAADQDTKPESSTSSEPLELHDNTSGSASVQSSAPSEASNEASSADQSTAPEVISNPDASSSVPSLPSDTPSSIAEPQNSNVALSQGSPTTILPTQALQMSIRELSLPYLGEYQLSASYVDGTVIEPLDIVWSSDNTEVVTIGQMGKVRTVGVGTTTVTASFGESSAKCTITVTPIVVELDYSDITALDKTYDGTTTAQIQGQLKLKDIQADIAFDQLGILRGEFASKNAARSAQEVTISASGYTLDNPNYALPENISYQTTACINAAMLTVDIPDFALPFGAPTPDYSLYRGIGAAGEVPKGEWSVSYYQNGREVQLKYAGEYDVETRFKCTDSNYVRKTYTAYSKLTISPKVVTVTGLRVQEKVYDGKTDAIILGRPLPTTPFVGDVYIAGGIEGVFDNANAGANKEVQVTGLTLKGKDADNYSLLPLDLRGNITKRSIGVSYNGQLQKTYDKTDQLALNPDNLSLEGVLPQDFGTVHPVGARATLSSARPGKSIKAFGVEVELAGLSSANYEVRANTVTVDIVPAPLKVTSMKAVDRHYDGTTLVEVEGGELTGVLAGDDVVLTGSATGVVLDKHVGTKTVKVSGLLLDGKDKDCYTLESPEDISASITPKVLLLQNAKVADKVYDGTVNADILSGAISPPLSGDEVLLDLSKISASFESADAGAKKAVILQTTDGLLGVDAKNYTLALEQEIYGEVLKASPILSLVSQNFSYDGIEKSLQCEVNSFKNPHLLAGEVRYSYVKQGESTTSNRAPIDAGVYAVTAELEENKNYHGTVSKSATLTITKADVTTVQMRDHSVIYDGLEKELTVQGELPLGTTVRYFGNKQTSTGSYPVTAVIEGKNYNTLILNASLRILKDQPDVKLVADKAYALQGDVITLKATLSNSQIGGYETKLPSSITLLINDTQRVTLDGEEGVYRYKYTAGSLQGKVTFQVLSADCEIYLASASQIVEVLVSNKLPSIVKIKDSNRQLTYGDDYTVDISVRSGDQAAAGEVMLYHNEKYIKAVALEKGIYHYKLSSDLLKAGQHVIKVEYAGDELTASSEDTISLTVAPKKLNISIVVQDKEYDGSAIAQVQYTLAGGLPNELVTATGKAMFESSHVGQDKLVTISDITLVGENSSNYTVDPLLTTRASIHKKLLTAQLIAHDKSYDTTDEVNITTQLIGVVRGEKLTANTLGRFNDALVGEGKEVILTSIELVGSTATNYDVKVDALPRANIEPRELKFLDTEVELYYSGFGQQITLQTDVIGVELEYSYYKDGAEVSPPIVYCGEYEVKAVPKSSNYTSNATVSVKVVPHRSFSPYSLPSEGAILSSPIAVLASDTSLIDKETGHFLKKSDYRMIEPMLQISEPDTMEYGKMQGAVGLLGDYEHIGYMSLSLMAQLQETSGGRVDKSVEADQPITVCLPYPSGTDRASHAFQLLHVGRSGAEQVELIARESWLEFRVDDFSPFALAYAKKPEIVEPVTPTDPVDRPSISKGSGYDLGKSVVDWQLVLKQIMLGETPVVINANLEEIPAYIIDAIRDSDLEITLLYKGESITINGRYLPPYEAGRVYYPLDMLCQKYGAGLQVGDAASTRNSAPEIEQAKNAVNTHSPTVTYKISEDMPDSPKSKDVLTKVSDVPAKTRPLFVTGVLSGVLLTLMIVVGVQVVLRKKDT